MGEGYPSDWSSRREKVLQRDSYRCQDCNVQGGPGENTELQLQVHHITPKSEGGSHKLQNLKTLCKSCHEDVHGHGVGGRSTSTSESRSSTTNITSSEEVDPEAVVASFILIVVLAPLVLTGAAIMQVTPDGQTVTQSYELDYHLVKDDPYGRGTEYIYYHGPPLDLEFTIHDNIITEDGETKIAFLIANPADHHLRGRLTIKQAVTYSSEETTLFTIDYDLPPDSQDKLTVVVNGSTLYTNSHSLPTTTSLTIENEIRSDGYYALYPEKQNIGNNKITIRKPLFSRFGFYWLCLVILVIVTASIGWTRRYLS